MRKPIQRQFLGAPGSLREALEGRFPKHAGQIIAKSSALLPKTLADEGEEARCIADPQFRGAIVGRQADHGGLDFGWRLESRWRDIEHQLDAGEQLCLNAEIAIVARVWPGCQTLRHFLLNHENGSLQPRCSRRQGFFDDRCGGVVRQIASHGGRTPLAQIYLSGICFDEREVRLVLELLAEECGEGRVDLDGDHALRALEQVRGESAASGADLNDRRAAVGTRQLGDALKYRIFFQEVLAEPLARHEAPGSAFDDDLVAPERDQHFARNGQAKLSGRLEWREQDHIGDIVSQLGVQIVGNGVIDD